MSAAVAARRRQSLAIVPRIVPQRVLFWGMPERRSKGDDAIYFEHDGPCKDSTRHRRCQGRWRGEITLGRSPQGRRLRRRVSGVSKSAVQDALNELWKQIDGGIPSAPVNYTVRRYCVGGLSLSA